MSTDSKTKPVTHIQVGGIQIPIWKNDGKDGSFYRAGAPELRYRDEAGEWHSGKSFSQRDLVNLTKAAMLAHSEIGRLTHADDDVSGDEIDNAPSRTMSGEEFLGYVTERARK